MLVQFRVKLTQSFPSSP